MHRSSIGDSDDRRDGVVDTTRFFHVKLAKVRLPRACTGSLPVVSALLFPVLFAPCLSLLQPAANAQSAKNPAGGLRTLTTAREAHSLSDEEAKSAIPVHLQGVIRSEERRVGKESRS